ncbi:MAG: hypothetical protein ABI690_21780 [Chloroflexota bacterium]
MSANQISDVFAERAFELDGIEGALNCLLANPSRMVEIGTANFYLSA